MVYVEFEYKDAYSRVEAVKKFYGLGVDCEYRITKVEKR